MLDKGGEGQKMRKNCVTSFIDGPLGGGDAVAVRPATTPPDREEVGQE